MCMHAKEQETMHPIFRLPEGDTEMAVFLASEY